jgi:hypothetical protein
MMKHRTPAIPLKRCVLLLLLLLTSPLAPAQTDSASTRWKAVGFLIGTWDGEGGGSPGEGTGWFSFAPDLQGTVLLRKNHSDYPPQAGRTAYSHDDLMILHHQAGDSLRAVYFDNEGHVIHYSVTGVVPAHRVVFLSDSNDPGPKFRLTYEAIGPDSVRITFDMAPPGPQSSFSQYLSATAHRRK